MAIGVKYEAQTNKISTKIAHRSPTCCASCDLNVSHSMCVCVCLRVWAMKNCDMGETQLLSSLKRTSRGGNIFPPLPRIQDDQWNAIKCLHMLTHSNSATLWEKVGDKDTPAVLILSIHTQGCKDTSNGATLWAALACVLVWNRILFTCRAIKEQHARLALNTKLLDKAKCLQYSKMPVLMGQNKERRVILLQHGSWYFKMSNKAKMCY